MIFTQFNFLFFFALVLSVYWSLRGNTLRKAWLLLCSFAFYASWNWRFLLLILGTTHVDYLAGLCMVRTTSPIRRKALLVASLSANIGVLGFFKYFNFFVASAAKLSALLGLPLQAHTLAIVLPLGISFHTFQAMSYSIDVYRGRLKPTSSLLDFALYIAFFPQLVAGPIVRASEFLPELAQAKSWADVDTRRCLVLFLVGFCKKACVSDNIAPLIDPYFSEPWRYTAGSAWLALLLYSAQIYCDFSGYADMAIASAGLMGYPMVRNFDFPYFSENVQVLWRRWHISLSSWLRDYLYVPLGGSRESEWMAARNVMIVMTIAGLWHGAAWNFVLWGVLEGAVLVAYRFLLRPLKWSCPPALGRLATFLYLTSIGWVLFRSTSLANIWTTSRALFLWHSFGAETLPVGLAGLFLLLAAAHYVSYRGWLSDTYRKASMEAFYFLYGAAFAVALSLAQTTYAPFIYFQF